MDLEMLTNNFSKSIFPHLDTENAGLLSTHSAPWVCHSLRDMNSQHTVRTAWCWCAFWPLGRRCLWSSRSRVMSCDLFCPQTRYYWPSISVCIVLPEVWVNLGSSRRFVQVLLLMHFVYLPLSILNLNLS